jgi:hypothetical protein
MPLDPAKTPLHNLQPGCSRPLLLVIANACLLSTSPSCHCECLSALDLSFLSLRMPVCSRLSFLSLRMPGCSRPLLLVIANAWALSTGMKQSLNTHTFHARLLRRFLASHTTVTDRSAPRNDKSCSHHIRDCLFAFLLDTLRLQIDPLLAMTSRAYATLSSQYNSPQPPTCLLSTSPSCHCECLGALDRHEAIS